LNSFLFYLNESIYIILFILLTLNSCKTNIIKIENSLTTEKIKDSLAFELCQIYGLDQGIRNRKLSKPIKEQQSVDTLNFNRIVDFVKKNGFPTKKLIGDSNWANECVEAASGAVLFYNPHRLVNENEYFELFLSEVKKGNMTSEAFALILDKYYWTISKNKKNRRVFYGSQFGKPCIQTKEATNKARVEIGLSALKDDEFVDCAGEILDMPKERK
jgi:hypothetical protein